MTIELVKVKRLDPLEDEEPNFDPLTNLHLELLENKKKVKKDAKIPTVKPIPSRTPPVDPVSRATPKEETDANKSESDQKEAKKRDEDRVKDDKDEELEDLLEELKDSKKEEPSVKEEQHEPPSPPPPEVEEEKEETQEEYLWRFKILKQKLRGTEKAKDIPDYTEFSDLPTMKTTYQRLIREIQMEENADSYESWLMMGSFALEYGATNLLKIDMSGFASYQMSVKHKYRPLLVELGERSYNQWSTNFPVEVRLLFVLVTQACFFMIIKYLERNQGPEAADGARRMMGVPLPVSEPPKDEPPKKKRSMRGPSVKVEDLKSEEEMSSTNTKTPSRDTTTPSHDAKNTPRESEPKSSERSKRSK